MDTEMQEKGVEGKNRIKERYNELAQQVTIDTGAFIDALTSKKKVSFPLLSKRRFVCTIR